MSKPWVSIVEEMVLNPKAMPAGFEDWRIYRIEYCDSEGVESAERHIMLPPACDSEVIENAINDAVDSDA